MTTISDVAAHAGVSVATVSRTLRGSTRVDPRTRERVFAAAADLNYVASPTAMSLASGRTNVIAVVAPLMSRWFFATIVTTVEQSLRDKGYYVLLIALEGGREGAATQQLTDSMFAKRVDGIISLNVNVGPDELAMLERLDLPLASVGTPVGHSPRVMIDDAAAVHTAVQHLIDLGHRRIGYVGTARVSVAHMSTPAARVDAYRDALTAAGLPVNEDWVIDSDWTATAAAAGVAPLLTGADRPSAILAASDEMAIGVLGAARRAGLRVPEDLSVMGIDDHTFAEVLGLSTIHQDVSAQGDAAVALLLGALQHDRDPSDEVVVIPTQLVVRETTAPPSGG